MIKNIQLHSYYVLRIRNSGTFIQDYICNIFAPHDTKYISRGVTGMGSLNFCISSTSAFHSDRGESKHFPVLTMEKQDGNINDFSPLYWCALTGDRKSDFYLQYLPSAADEIICASRQYVC
jgi:hypothetical protein